MATAVVSVGFLQELVPDDFRVLPRFVYLIILFCFLAVLIVGDPGRIDRQRRWLRVATLLMFGLITLARARAAVRLVDGVFTMPGSPLPTNCWSSGWLINVKGHLGQADHRGTRHPG